MLLRSFITDSIYLAQRLEAVLQEVFGDNKKILDCLSATVMGILLGITVILIKPELFIFTNYNRLENRDDKKYKEYGILLGNVLVWEM